MSVSEKLGVKKSNLIGLIIVALAVIFGLLHCIIRIVNHSYNSLFLIIASIVIFALIIVFALWGYKVPNGKMLKYVYLLFALKLGLQAGVYAADAANIAFILTVCSTILVAYVGGRLPRIKENKVNCALILVMLLANGIVRIIQTGDFHFVLLSSFIQALALIFAYFARAQQYKENSGILDDK